MTEPRAYVETPVEHAEVVSYWAEPRLWCEVRLGPGLTIEGRPRDVLDIFERVAKELAAQISE